MKFELKKRKKQNENVNKFQPKKNKTKFKWEKQIIKKWDRKKEEKNTIMKSISRNAN